MYVCSPIESSLWKILPMEARERLKTRRNAKEKRERATNHGMKRYRLCPKFRPVERRKNPLRGCWLASRCRDGALRWRRSASLWNSGSIRKLGELMAMVLDDLAEVSAVSVEEGSPKRNPTRSGDSASASGTRSRLCRCCSGCWNGVIETLSRLYHLSMRAKKFPLSSTN